MQSQSSQTFEAARLAQERARDLLGGKRKKKKRKKKVPRSPHVPRHGGRRPCAQQYKFEKLKAPQFQFLLRVLDIPVVPQSPVLPQCISWFGCCCACCCATTGAMVSRSFLPTLTKR